MSTLHTKLTIIAALMLTLATTAAANSMRSAREVAMAGSGTSLARGLEGARANPANLAWSDNPSLSVGLFSGSFMVGNNGIDIDLYNRSMGAELTSSDINEILDTIPADGLRTEAAMDASVLGVQFGRVALTFNGQGAGSSRLPHELFELLLDGNASSDSLSFDQADAEAYSVAAVRASTGIPVGRSPWGAVHLGMSMAYLQGIGFARLEELHGSLATDSEGIRGEAQAEFLTASKGAGFGLDLGLAAELGTRWRAGLVLHNAYARVHYDQGLERHFFSARLDSLDVATLQEVDNSDDLFTQTDVTVAAEPFTVALPRTLRASVGRQGWRTSWNLELEQGFGDRAGTTTTTRAAIGCEWRQLSWLPLRAGISVGGRTEKIVSMGLGVHTGPFAFDVAVASVGEWMPGSPRGLLLALGTGLQF